jgi:hypothetical protein
VVTFARWDVRGPTENHAGERLGNHEAVPRAKLPGALRLVVEAANPGPGGLFAGSQLTD